MTAERQPAAGDALDGVVADVSRSADRRTSASIAARAPSLGVRGHLQATNPCLFFAPTISVDSVAHRLAGTPRL